MNTIPSSRTSFAAQFSRVALWATLPVLLAGCGGGSLLSRAGPTINAIMAPDKEEGQNSQYAIVKISPETITPYLRQAERETTRDVALPGIPEIKLVPGDVLRIMVADSNAEGAVFASLANGGTVFDNVRLDSRGQISLPYVGQKKVSGTTLTDVEGMIRKSLRGIASDPQARVELISDLSGSVLVAGAVKSPGRFSALKGPLTLLDAINGAGGPVLEPHLIRVVVRTGNEAYTFNYEELLAGKNQFVPPNSEVVLERARKRFVAMGAVGTPGLHDLPSNNPSLLEALGVVGGLKETSSDPSGVFVFRLTDPISQFSGETPQPAAQVFSLDMKQPESIFLAQQFLIQPEDSIYVTNAAVYEWQKIISPIVQVLLLGRMVENR